MTDTTNEGFDLDEAVEGQTFETESFEVEADEDTGDESTNGETKPRAKKTDEDDVPHSEFQFDATPRPRAAAGEKKEPGQKRSFVPLPEGWATPTQLKNILFERRIVKIPPQQVYGFVKSGKDFPYKLHVDGRYIVPLEDHTAQEAGDTLVNGKSEIGALQWVINRFAQRAERLAKAQEKQAADEAEPTSVTESPSEDGPVTTDFVS